MSQPADIRVPSPSPWPIFTRRFLLRVCTNNPFYVLSAGLFLFGLRVSYGEPIKAVQTWPLMGGLASYTLLLAATASFLVRFGNIWDDVRTILLLVVLMFLATSVTFDEVLFLNPLQGAICNLTGLLLAIAISEALLRIIRLRLPTWFRIPYYLTLALFFLYPVALSTQFGETRSESLLWGLYGFSAVAGLVALTLLPAIRRGPDYVANNGSPWCWPLYPWVLFALLGAAVPARAFLLCWSMDQLVSDDRERLIFGFYFLVPFGLAVAVLLLEQGIVSFRRDTLRSALFMPVLMICLTLIGHRTDPIYQEFRIIFVNRLGVDPLTLTLLASACFYGYAALRRVPVATEALTATLVALAIVGPQTIDRYIFVSPRSTPLLAAAALQMMLGLWQRGAWRCLVGTLGVAASAAMAVPGKQTDPWHWLLAFHLAIVGLLMLGAVLDDKFGRAIRIAGAALVLLACLTATFGRFNFPVIVPSWAVMAYPPTMAVLLAGYGLLLDHRYSLAAATLAGASWLLMAGWKGYLILRELEPGLSHIALSLVFFVLAVLVSLGKAGVFSRWLKTYPGNIPEPAYIPAVVAENPSQTTGGSE